MLPAILLSIGAILYRLFYILAGAPVPWANFSPVAAIFLCSGVYFPRKSLIAIPAVALFISDLLLNAHYHAPLLDARMLPGYFSFGLIFLLGSWIRHQQNHKLLFLFGGTLLGSLLFYWITNSVDWFVDPSTPFPVTPYPKTFAGYLQALVVGHPGFTPTIYFLRNSAVSDLLFTALLVLTQRLASVNSPALRHAKNHS